MEDPKNSSAFDPKIYDIAKWDDWDKPPPLRTTPLVDPAPRSIVQPAQATQAAPADDAPRAAPTLAFPNANLPSHFPDFVARSGIFAPGLGGDPSQGRIEIPAQGCRVLFDGPRLTMHDKTVWETAVQWAKEEPLGDALGAEITLRGFAARMGWKDGSSKAGAWIRDSLSRLSEAHVEFDFEGGARGSGLLIAKALFGEGERRVEFDPSFVLPAFGMAKQFRIDCARRRRLNNALAQWMHDFLSTHSTERDLDVAYLREIVRHKGIPKRFPELLRAALAQLKTEVPALVAEWHLKKARRRSAGQILVLSRGPEQPKFRMPQTKEPQGAPKAKARSKSGGLHL